MGTLLLRQDEPMSLRRFISKELLGIELGLNKLGMYHFQRRYSFRVWMRQKHKSLDAKEIKRVSEAQRLTRVKARRTFWQIECCYGKEMGGRRESAGL